MNLSRYLIATAASALIQGGVLASMATPEPIELASGQLSQVAISLKPTALTAVSKAEPKPAPQPKSEPTQQKSEPTPQPKPKPTPRSKPELPTPPNSQPASQPTPQPKLDSPPLSKQQATPKPEQQVEPATEPAPESGSAPAQGAKLQPVSIDKPLFKRPPTPPKYPRLARKRNQQGTAMVEVWLDALGEQTQLTLVTSSGFNSLDKAAIAAVEAWQFQPLRRNGVGIPSKVQIPVRFALN